MTATPAPAASAREPGPCPWCGPGNSMVDAWFDDLGKHWRVNCGRCGGGCGWHKERDGAITAWNARPAPAEPPAGEG